MIITWYIFIQKVFNCIVWMQTINWCICNPSKSIVMLTSTTLKLCDQKKSPIYAQKYNYFSYMVANKIFCTCLLPYFLFENKQNSFSNFKPSFNISKQMIFFVFFMGISSLPLTFESKLCYIIWTWKFIPNNYVIFWGWGWF